MTGKTIVGLLMCIAVASMIPVARSAGQSDNGSPSAASKYGSRAAVLDIVRIFEECVRIKDLNEEMRKNMEDFRTEVNQRREAIADQKLRLGAYRVGTEEYEKQRRELLRMNIELRNWAEITESDLERQRFDWTRIIYEQAAGASERIARDRGYDLVMLRTAFKPDDIAEQSVQGLRLAIQQRNVVFHAPGIDITDAVLERMDSEYKTAGRPNRPTANPPTVP